MTLADKIVVLKDGEVMQSAARWSSTTTPSNLFVAGFLGAPSMNFIKVDGRESVADAHASVLKPVSRPHTGTDRRTQVHGVATRQSFAVRPQYLTPTDPDKGMLHGTVALTERLGAETVIDITLRDGSSFIAAVAEDRVLQPGTRLASPPNFEATRRTSSPMRRCKANRIEWHNDRLTWRGEVKLTAGMASPNGHKYTKSRRSKHSHSRHTAPSNHLKSRHDEYHPSWANRITSRPRWLRYPGHS